MALEKQRMYRKNIDGTKDLIYRETSSDLVKHGDTDLNTKINGIDSSLAENTNKISFLETLKLKFVYGAKLDGITDDSLSLYNYITNEKIIYIPNVNIALNSEITLSNINNKTIISDGCYITTTLNKCILNFTSCTNITINGLTFDMTSQKSGDNTKNFVAKFLNCSNIKIENNNMFNGCNGIYFENVDDLTFKNNTMKDFAWWSNYFGGAYGKYVTNAIISNNISKNNKDGIKLTGCLLNVSIFNNKCYNNTQDGIDYAGQSCNNVNIYNNICEYNELNGIEFKSLDTTIYPPENGLDTSVFTFSNVKIQSNFIRFNKQKGINVENRSSYLTDKMNFVEISGNEILGTAINYGTANIGINLYAIPNGNKLKVFNNTVDGKFISRAISIEDVNSVLIYDNELHATINTIYGNIVSNVKLSNININNNKIYSDSNYCVRFQCDVDYFTLTNNKVSWSDNAYRILLEKESTSTNLTMFNNEVINYNNSVIPTGRSTWGEVIYSSNPKTSNCLGWYCQYGGVTPQWKVINQFV